MEKEIAAGWKASFSPPPHCSKGLRRAPNRVPMNHHLLCQLETMRPTHGRKQFAERGKEKDGGWFSRFHLLLFLQGSIMVLIDLYPIFPPQPVTSRLNDLPEYRVFQRNRYISSIPLWQTMPGVKWTSCCLKHYRGISIPKSSLGPFQAASGALCQSLKQILTLFTSYSVLWAL